jgi:hypothetical protein
LGARNLGLHYPDHLTQYPKEFAMSKTAVTSPELAPPVGPFSQAIEVGGFLYFSGQVDKNIRYQQNLTRRRIAILVLENAQWPILRPRVGRLVAAVNAATPGSYTEVQIPHAG